MAQPTHNRRVATDETVTDLPDNPTPTSEVLVAEIPGGDPAKYVTLTLSHPLNRNDRQYLGLPLDAPTEVGQKVRVSKNGAKAIVSSGYATVDPEDGTAVAKVMSGLDESDTSTGGPMVEPGQDEAPAKSTTTAPPSDGKAGGSASGSASTSGSPS